MTAAAGPAVEAKLPLLGLSALAAAGFLTILTEALPAGLLSAISQDLEVTPAMVGQLVTAYALGSLSAAIPLTTATRSWRRRPLLLLAIGGFLVVNGVTALSGSYVATLVARFAAGVFAGLVWALLAGYAARMAPAHLVGRAIAIAMVGTPLALSIGIPFGTMMSTLVGWRPVFLALSGASLALMVLILWKVPDYPGEQEAERHPFRSVLALPGLGAVLAATLGFVLAHNLLYTYIEPFLDVAGLGSRLDAVLLLFGVAAVGGIWLTGVYIDSRLRMLALSSTVAFGLAAAAMGLLSDSPVAVLVGVAAWGVAFGGSATFFQTASARLAGPSADVAQSMIVTVWNMAIAAGGVIGGLILQYAGAPALPWSVFVVLGLVFWLIVQSSKGFSAS